MPASQGDNTRAPMAGSTAAVLEAATDTMLDVGVFVCDTLQPVLTDGDLDDWSRGELSMLLRRFKTFTAAVQAVIDK